VFDLDDGAAFTVNDFERPVLHVLLDVGLGEPATDETLGVEHGVFGVGVVGVLSGISNSDGRERALGNPAKDSAKDDLQSFLVRERDP
jgi:hypothetical protein